MGKDDLSTKMFKIDTKRLKQKLASLLLGGFDIWLESWPCRGAESRKLS